MLSTKTLHPAVNCQTIAEVYRDLQLEVMQVEREIREVAVQIDRLSRQILSTTSDSERHQLGEDQSNAQSRIARLDANLAQLGRRLQDVQNNYVMANCANILGPL